MDAARRPRPGDRILMTPSAIPNEEFFGQPIRRIRRPWRVIRAGALDAEAIFLRRHFFVAPNH